MQILVLDDNEILCYEPESFLDNPHDYREDAITQTANVKDFVRLFFTEEWAEVWIDHDLGNTAYNGRTATKDIYNYILGSGRKMKSEPLIRITSMNDYAAKIMISDLQQCGLSVIRYPISRFADYGVRRGDTINVFPSTDTI